MIRAFLRCLSAGALIPIAVTGGLAAMPTAAAAQPYGYERPTWRDGTYQAVRDRRFRGERRFDRRGYGRPDYGDRRGYARGYRCRDRGTGGTIIGAIAGGLLGDAVVGRRGDRTAGAIVGAGVGALAGRSIDRSDGRPC